MTIVEGVSLCISHHLQYYDELYSIFDDPELDASAKLVLISKISREHSVFLCSRLAEIFGLITGKHCHSSVKTFSAATGQVTTRTRDALMHNQDRVLADEALRSYHYELNTAFSSILRKPAAVFT